jgi:hypothetical protein
MNSCFKNEIVLIQLYHKHQGMEQGMKVLCQFALKRKERLARVGEKLV